MKTLLVILALASASVSLGQARSPIVKTRPRALEVPMCSASLPDGTLCRWSAPGIVFPVTVATQDESTAVQGFITFATPYAFRGIQWTIKPDVADGPACPDVQENNLEFSGFGIINIECAP